MRRTPSSSRELKLKHHGELSFPIRGSAFRDPSLELSFPFSEFCADFDTTHEKHAYEIRPRRDNRSLDLISDVLPFGKLWYAEPNTISTAIGYAKFRSRSHNAVIRVYDDAGNVSKRTNTRPISQDGNKPTPKIDSFSYGYCYSLQVPGYLDVVEDFVTRY